MAEAALDASLPGGLIEGSGDMRYAQTMAFTTLLFFSLFTVFTARSDVQSAFVGLSSNLWLWAAVLLSLALQLAVIYVPFLQQAFSTVNLSRWRLALLRRGGKLRAVGARIQQVPHPRADGVTHDAAMPLSARPNERTRDSVISDARRARASGLRTRAAAQAEAPDLEDLLLAERRAREQGFRERVELFTVRAQA